MLQSVSLHDFDALYDIMTKSFPTDELRPYALQRALFAREDYRVYGLFDGAELQAFMAVYTLEKALFVEHFAVSAKYRNQGLGAKLLQELIAGSELPLCLEVEPPRTVLAKRRIGFYERNGFFYNDFPYFQPPLAEGQKPVELKLMTTGHPLSETEFQKLKALLHTRVYQKAK